MKLQARITAGLGAQFLTAGLEILLPLKKRLGFARPWG
jgi:hypothetical protein